MLDTEIWRVMFICQINAREVYLKMMDDWFLPTNLKKSYTSNDLLEGESTCVLNMHYPWILDFFFKNWKRRGSLKLTAKFFGDKFLKMLLFLVYSDIVAFRIVSFVTFCLRGACHAYACYVSIRYKKDVTFHH